MIDEAGAAQRILPKSKQKKTIGKAEIEDIISKIARIPAQSVNQDDRSKLQNLDRDLKSVVFGQDAAIDALSASIKMARAGLGKTDQTDWRLPLLRADRGGQDRSGKTARFHIGNRSDPFRHV